LNPTTNAVQNNEEHLVVISDRNVCKKVDRWFEKLWDESRVVTSAEIDEIAAKLDKLKEEKAAKKEMEKRYATPKSQPKRKNKKDRDSSPVPRSYGKGCLAKHEHPLTTVDSRRL
jgi:sRNA-binding protein